VEHDYPWTLPRGDIIGRAIVTQRFELLAEMGAQRIAVIARRFRLFKSAAHCCFSPLPRNGGQTLSPLVLIRFCAPALICSDSDCIHPVLKPGS
jgi:hypothetical protein